MRIYDISPLLHPGIAVWPGDVPFARLESAWISRGDSVNLSSMQCSLHTGAHADAPSHFLDGGPTIDEVDLSVYLGRARLVTLAGDDAIRSGEMAALLMEKVERLLVRSNPGLDPDRFPSEFRHFSPECAAYLGNLGVRLLGTDGPSVDAFHSKELPVHRSLGKQGVAILENLQLHGVPDGEYQLIALPLRIAGGDASPVRAILRQGEIGDSPE